MPLSWNLRVLILLVACLLALAAISCTGGSGNDEDDEEDDEVNFDNLDDPDPDGDFIVPPIGFDPPPWPEWALQHWVWEDESTQDSALALVKGYLDHDVPVGAIIIDSPWETGYNTFEFDPDIYPEPQDMVDDLHAMGARVMLWTTPNVNEDSPNFQEGLDNGYFVNDGWTVEWWKGLGAFIDYNNPEALAWWHDQVDNVLDLGIDGWKCDGSEFYLYIRGVVQTHTGTISVADYQALYYSDFFNYTRKVLGSDRIITARPVDSYGIPFYGPSFAPVDVNFAGWVGDQDPTWSGLRAALINLFFSAERGYVNFGSDIAGYRGDEIRDKELFLRWAQLGALCPVMENGGAGEHRPWMYDNQTLSIYRDFTKLHHALIPYLYSQGAQSYQFGVSLMRPVQNRKSFMLGDSIFVSVIDTPSTERSVTLPDGDWIDFWDGAEFAGGQTITVDYPLERYPIFVRKGAVIPMDLREGTVFSKTNAVFPPLTVHLYPQGNLTRQFDLYEEKGAGARIVCNFGQTTTIRLSASTRDFAFRVMNVAPVWMVETATQGKLPGAPSRDALTEMESGWIYLEESGELWIKPGDASKGQVITF